MTHFYWGIRSWTSVSHGLVAVCQSVVAHHLRPVLTL